MGTLYGTLGRDHPTARILAMPIPSLGRRERERFTLAADAVIDFPQRCAACGSRDLGDPAVVELTCDSVVDYHLEGSEIKGQLTHITRENRARLSVPLCHDHQPSRSKARHLTPDAKVYSINELRIKTLYGDLRVGLGPVWEPRSGQHFAGKWHKDAKAFLNHPVMFFEFDLPEAEYRREFTKANERWVSHTRRLERENVASLVDFGEAAPKVWSLAENWAAHPGRWVRVHNSADDKYNNSELEFVVEDETSKHGIDVAEVRLGVHAITFADDPPVTLVVYLNKLRKKLGLADVEVTALTELVRAHLPSDAHLKMRAATIPVATADPEGLGLMLDWIGARIEEHRVAA
jgi:hypothetical protein